LEMNGRLSGVSCTRGVPANEGAVLVRRGQVPGNPRRPGYFNLSDSSPSSRLTSGRCRTRRVGGSSLDNSSATGPRVPQPDQLHREIPPRDRLQNTSTASFEMGTSEPCRPPPARRDSDRACRRNLQGNLTGSQSGGSKAVAVPLSAPMGSAELLIRRRCPTTHFTRSNDLSDKWAHHQDPASPRGLTRRQFVRDR